MLLIFKQVECYICRYHYFLSSHFFIFCVGKKNRRRLIEYLPNKKIGELLFVLRILEANPEYDVLLNKDHLQALNERSVDFNISKLPRIASALARFDKVYNVGI